MLQCTTEIFQFSSGRNPWQIILKCLSGWISGAHQESEEHERNDIDKF